MSDIMSSAISFSCILLNVTSPLMLLKFFRYFVSNILAKGVTSSVFHFIGQIPCFIELLIISVRGIAMSVANSFMIFGGISPFCTAFLVLTSFSFSATSKYIVLDAVFKYGEK